MPVLLLCLGACRPHGAVDAVVHSDSAGVAIVLNAYPPGALRRYAADTVPLQSVGAIGGSAEFNLSGVTAATLLDDGSIVLADNGSRQLRRFAKDGRHAWSAGSDGGGPGEFRSISWLVSAGDSLVAYDPTLTRVSAFSASGALLGTWSPPSPGDQVLLFLGRDRFLTGRLAPMSELEASGSYLDRSRLVAISAVGDTLGVLEAVPLSERQARVGAGGSFVFAPPFGSRALFVDTGGGFCYSFGPAFRVDCYDLTGGLLRVVRLRRPPATITRDQIERFARRFASLNPEASRRPETERRFRDDWEYPALAPAFAALLPDRVGGFWAQAYDIPRLGSPDWFAWPNRGTSEWMRFDSSGVATATARIPADWQVFEIHETLVLAKWLDRLDVERVGTFALRSVASGARDDP